MRDFFYGACMMAAAVIGLIFLHFWKKSRDRLFIFFALSFWVLGANWLALTFVRQDEPQTALYAVRLVAFGLIMLGIWDKNRQRAM